MQQVRWIGLVILALLSWNGVAKEQALAVNDAFIRAPIPGMKNTSAYMSLNNGSDKPVVLVAAESSYAKRIEFHDHIMANGVMQMTQVDQITIAPKQSVTFQSGGLHLMLFELSKQAEEPIWIRFITSDGQQVNAKFNVRSVHHEHHHH
mgnify:CR=1 FL=1